MSLVVSPMTSTHAVHHTLLALSPFPMRSPFAAPWQTPSEPWKAQLRVSLPLRVPGTVSRTTWNPSLELLFHEQISGAFEPFVDEIDLAMIALSCRFALDVLCYKGVHGYA